MDAIQCKLPVFEGPLDLLLHLVQKNKLNIYDIPIAEVLEQYMDVLHQMQQMDMDIATEFLEMAARLVHIKSIMLLPKHEEETAQLKAELTGQLIEYQICQEMACRLSTLWVGGDLFVREPMPLPPDYTYRLKHAPRELMLAFLAAVGKGKRRLPPPVQAFSGIVNREIIPVSSKIVYVLRRLREQKAVPYRSLFATAKSKSELVATFLALLELIKEKRIVVEDQPADSAQLMVRLRDGQTKEPMEGFVSEFEEERQGTSP